VHQLVHDLAIEELEGPLALLDDRHLGAELREHRGVLGPDDPGADDRQRPGHRLQADDVVAREDRLAVGLDPRGLRGVRAHAHEDELGGELPFRVRHPHADRVRVHEVRLAPDHGHVVTAKLPLDDLLLDPDRLPDLREEILRLGARAATNDLAGLEAPRRRREVQDRFAEGLAGDRPQVHADAPHRVALLDDGDLLAELRGLDRRALAGGTLPMQIRS